MPINDNEAYICGTIAFYNGVNRDENPYPTADDRKDWERGRGGGLLP